MIKKWNYRTFFICTIIFVLFSAVFPENAHAGYLDPGSGSTLAQVIIAVAAGIRRWWNMILSPFTRFFKK